MLAVEDRNIFREAELEPDRDGKLRLPDGVAFEDIALAVSDGRPLLKEDLRQSVLRRKCRTAGRVTIVYLAPFVPIRTVSYFGDARFSAEESRLYLGKNGFMPDDIITVCAGDETFTAAVDGVGVLGDGFYLELTGNMTEDFSGADIKITRRITEKTVCNAPYDTMYIDYIIAKIALYQHDFESYNQFMAAFNSRLNAYKRRMADIMPQARRKFCNWW